MAIFYRFNNAFIIKDSELPVSARNIAVKNALYADTYAEFLGAIHNPKYKHMTALEKMNTLNAFADKWLKDRGYK
jgi:hypothetical protein